MLLRVVRMQRLENKRYLGVAQRLNNAIKEKVKQIKEGRLAYGDCGQF
jgi:hypothetical protein